MEQAKKLSLNELQNAGVVRRWKTNAENETEKALIKGTSRAAAEVAGAADVNQKAECKKLLEDTVASTVRMEKKMFLDKHVELGAGDDFDLERLWQGSGRINTAAANLDEKRTD